MNDNNSYEIVYLGNIIVIYIFLVRLGNRKLIATYTK